MDKFIIQGQRKLKGEVPISGAKNAALPLIAAALLTDQECVLDNVPSIEDIRVLTELLVALGAEAEFAPGKHRLTVCAKGISSAQAPSDLATRMRASFLVTGPLLARFGEAVAPHPGGCAIGVRPVNVDIKGFVAMGAEVRQENGYYAMRAGRLQGKRLYLDYPSHTGTENLLMAACMAEGQTTLTNASGEPEVVGLAACLSHMGARIWGAGSSVIEVEGVERLHGFHVRVIPDRIEAGTFAILAAMMGADITLRDVISSHMVPLTQKLTEAGAAIEVLGDTYRILPGEPLLAVEVQTLHFPGFPTDLQAALAVALTQAQGTSIIHERVYDNRLLYADELRKMGASVLVSGQSATILGPTPLHGATVRALDIRSGAAVVLAGLAADGSTEILDIHHIDRGYERVDEKLRALGAEIWRSTGEKCDDHEGDLTLSTLTEVPR